MSPEEKSIARSATNLAKILAASIALGSLEGYFS